MIYVFVTDKKWHDSIFQTLQITVPGQWLRIRDKEELTNEKLHEIQPDWVFIPHWSHIIPASVYENYRCVVFHMTDLPFGRGGSPLQNLIVRGLEETKISAIQVAKGLDTGDVYLKKQLDLSGTAEEIFIRSAIVVEEMIVEIIKNQLEAVPQTGDVVVFQRRKQSDGDLSALTSPAQVYDYIRMLDCEGYPPAFIETDNFRYEFSGAVIDNDESIKANVRIIKK
jgi:methionyl-tRNA formyltransferase